MLKKIFLTCLSFLTLHTLMIDQLKDRSMASHQQQRNTIKVQEYLYDQSDINVAIVGTSLSSMVQRDSLRPDVRNLAIEGGTVEEGLDLIAARSQKPSVVFIESNFLMKKNSSNLISDNTQFLIMQARKYIPILREENQPICVLTGFLNLLKNKGNKTKRLSETPVDSALLQSRIDAKIASYKPINKENELHRCKIIMEKIRNLQETGCKIVFFEMPVNPQLQKCEHVRTVRKIQEEAFPPTVYDYMQNDHSYYSTKDGIHLTLYESDRYTSYFKSQYLKWIK